jgi:hypothetical protein
MDSRGAYSRVAAIQKLLRVCAIVCLVVRRLTIVACHRIMPIGDIKPARIASVPIIETLRHVGMRGIDSLGRRHAPNLWDMLATAGIRNHIAVTSIWVVSVTTVAPSTPATVSGATSAVARVSPTTSLVETSHEPSALSERLDKGDMHSWGTGGTCIIVPCWGT